MADPSDPFALNVLGATDLVENPTNKIQNGNGDDPEGVQGEKYDVLEVDMDDDELLKLRTEREQKYAGYKAKHEKVVEKNLESYTGMNKDGNWLGGEDHIAANLQFEAEETFLASASAKNPEPVVFSDNTDAGNEISTGVRTMLTYHSHELALRRKFGMMVRQWSINHLGALKAGWNEAINDVSIENRKVQDFVFDPEGYVDAHGRFTSWLGERIKVSAKKLVTLFPEDEDYIRLTVDDKMGTECVYTEWWDDDFCFITYKERVLDKFKNPFYRYAEPATDELGQPILDEMTGEPTMTAPRNHFAEPQKPYIFMSVFSLQEQPHDITGLIQQNIPNQNRITRREDQVDYNAAAMNNTYALSEDNFNQETGKQFVAARKKGNPILIPQGSPLDQAVKELTAQEIPQGLFVALENDKNNLRTSWGVQGITAEPQDEDQTARGMILNQQHDTSRIGGGIGIALETVAGATFNWLTQLYYVFYDEEHFAAIMGNAKAVEYVTLSNADLDRQLIVTVAPDSLRPRDQITEMNLAQALFDKGAIGPKTLLKMIDFPNSDEAAADGVLYRIDPQTYLQLNFPDLAQKLMAAQQQKMMMEATMGAAATGMNANAEAGAVPPVPPEGITEPETPFGAPAASAALSEVPLPPAAVPA